MSHELDSKTFLNDFWFNESTSHDKAVGRSRFSSHLCDLSKPHDLGASVSLVTVIHELELIL